MLSLNKVTFGYREKAFVNEISFEIGVGKQLAVIGESGSGKTTLLKLIYGEFDLFSGSIYWNDTEILGPKFNLITGYDFMKMVSQEFDLMPFVTVEESVGGYLSNFFPEEKKKRTKEVLRVVGLEPSSELPLNKLSGGQKQRVALARALANEPQVLLLDEPFSHIDSFKKQELRRQLFRYLKDKGITTVVATHDKNDVLGFANQVIVLENGRMIANETPEDLYLRPPNTSIAAFFGEYNLIRPSKLKLPKTYTSDFIIYAHQLKISDDPILTAKVEYVQFNGSNYLVQAKRNDQKLLFYSDERLAVGTEVGLEIIR